MRRLLVALAFALFALPALAATPSIEDEMKTVEAIRQVHFKHPVELKTISRDDFRPLLEKEVATSLPVSQEDYVSVLKALYLVDASQKNLDPLLSLYEAQVLAFYDPRAHLFYAFKPDGEPSEFDAMVENAVDVHELTHAAQDQIFDAGKRMDSLEHDSDAQMAMQSLLEGEASLVMFDYMMSMGGASLDDVLKSDDDIADSIAQAANAQTKIPAGTPAYYIETLKFPYIEGLRFAIEAYRRGGWKELDRVEANPPTTTEQILHPELYFSGAAAGKPVLVRPEHSDFASRQWPFTFTMGEFNWKYLLGEKAASGWGGDSVELRHDAKGGVTVNVDTQWDTPKDAAEFADAYRAFLASKGAHAAIRTEGTRVVAAYGADAKEIAKFASEEKK